jgi:hypothetical protein
MGVFDQATRFATDTNPQAVVDRLLRGKGVFWQFREWADTRMLRWPGNADRTADQVAALYYPAAADSPWLMVLEFQAQVDPDKMDVTLEEVAMVRNHVNHGEERKGKYRVMAALVYLCGRCPEDMLDFTLPDGTGTRHAPLIWNIEDDDAAQILEAVAAEVLSWAMLFWVPLMAGGTNDKVIARWKEVVLATVADPVMRGNLAGIAVVFAELAGNVPAWKRGVEGLGMTESQVVNEWINQGEVKGELKTQRKNLLRLLNIRYAGLVSNEVTQLIQHQDSLELLGDWFDAAAGASSFEQFLAVLKR